MNRSQLYAMILAKYKASEAENCYCSKCSLWYSKYLIGCPNCADGREQQ